MRSNTDSQKFTSLTVVRAGLFISMSLALKVMFEIYIPLSGIPALRINFASIPLMLSGIILGPFTGFVTGAAADIINFIAKPGGPFFPGFTLASGLTGFLPGIVFKYIKKDEFGMGKTVLAVSLTQLITSIILNTYFLYVLYGIGITITLPARILTNLFTIPVYSLIIGAVLKALNGRIK